MIMDFLWSILFIVLGGIGVIKPELIGRNSRIKNMLVLRIIFGIVLVIGVFIFVTSFIF